MTQVQLQHAFDLLGVSPSDDFATIKAAWKKLVKQHHPDVAGTDPERAARTLAKINDAYDALRAHNPHSVKIKQALKEAEQAEARRAARARARAEAERRERQRQARAEALRAAEAAASRAKAEAEARAAQEQAAARAASIRRKCRAGSLAPRTSVSARRDGRAIAAARAYAQVRSERPTRPIVNMTA